MVLEQSHCTTTSLYGTLNESNSISNPSERAKIISKFQNSGTNAKNLITLAFPLPCSNVETATYFKSKTKTKPKNFQRDYRKRLQDIQKKNRSNAAEEQTRIEKKSQRHILRKQKKFGDVKSKVWDSISQTPLSPRSFVSSSTSVSTVSYDSSLQRNEKEREVPLTSIEVKSNEKKKRFVTSGLGNSQNNNSIASNYGKHKSFGKVPTYLVERKADLKKESMQNEECIDSTIKSNKTSNMVLMSELERFETISLLKDNEKKIKAQLFRLPLVAQNHGTIKKRKKLEEELHEIEEAKKIFSQKKVYIFDDCL